MVSAATARTSGNDVSGGGFSLGSSPAPRPAYGGADMVLERGVVVALL